jgi:hypothetical protein
MCTKGPALAKLPTVASHMHHLQAPSSSQCCKQGILPVLPGPGTSKSEQQTHLCKNASCRGTTCAHLPPAKHTECRQNAVAPQDAINEADKRRIASTVELVLRKHPEVVREGAQYRLHEGDDYLVVRCARGESKRGTLAPCPLVLYRWTGCHGSKSMPQRWPPSNGPHTIKAAQPSSTTPGRA